MDKPYVHHLSRHQYGALRFIKHNAIREYDLRLYKDSTVFPLFKNRGYIVSDGTGENPKIHLTETGEEALNLYETASLPERKIEADLTERTALLLRMVRTRNSRGLKKAS